MTHLEALTNDSTTPFVVRDIVALLRGKDPVDVAAYLTVLAEAAQRDCDDK